VTLHAVPAEDFHATRVEVLRAVRARGLDAVVGDAVHSRNCAVLGDPARVRSEAPTGRKSIAQGNALGNELKKIEALKGRNSVFDLLKPATNPN
jgi:hypothetical protein